MAAGEQPSGRNIGTASMARESTRKTEQGSREPNEDGGSGLKGDQSSRRQPYASASAGGNESPCKVGLVAGEVSTVLEAAPDAHSTVTETMGLRRVPLSRLSEQGLLLIKTHQPELLYRSHRSLNYWQQRRLRDRGGPRQPGSMHLERWERYDLIQEACWLSKVEIEAAVADMRRDLRSGERDCAAQDAIEVRNMEFHQAITGCNLEFQDAVKIWNADFRDMVAEWDSEFHEKQEKVLSVDRKLCGSSADALDEKLGKKKARENQKLDNFDREKMALSAKVVKPKSLVKAQDSKIARLMRATGLAEQESEECEESKEEVVVIPKQRQQQHRRRDHQPDRRR